ncbi:MAG TPA: hypothetical protein VLL94_10650 [Nitrospiraceae bacterium]|nr:hypothetical protein [Nitrospiraceae bacterium]
MRSTYYFVIMIGMVLALGASGGSLASAKTIAAGDTNSSWNGTGEVQILGNGDEVINGMVKGVMIARHKDDAKTVVHSSRLVCPVRVNLNRKNNSGAIAGLCTIVSHEGKDVAYGEWKCAGTLTDCAGEFTFTGGTGGFSGISGKTPFQTEIVFELQEGKHGQAIGYAVWPNLTYTLP